MNQMQQLAGRYEEVLQRYMGLDPQVAEEQVGFQAGPFFFVLVLDSGDPEFFHLVLPGFFYAGEGLSRGDAERICGEITHKCKVAKLTVADNGVAGASVEMLVAAADCLPTVEHLRAVVPRAIRMLQCAVYEFMVAVELHGIAQASNE